MMATGLSGSSAFSFGVSRVLAVNAATFLGATGGHIWATASEKYMSGRLGSTDSVTEVLAALVGATVSTRTQAGAL